MPTTNKFLEATSSSPHEAGPSLVTYGYREPTDRARTGTKTFSPRVSARYVTFTPYTKSLHGCEDTNPDCVSVLIRSQTGC